MEAVYECCLCPRMCGARRGDGETGFCGESDRMRISRVSLHMYEEPPISGKRGSGTIFFSGCTLRCAFCQNRAISGINSKGDVYTTDMLAAVMLDLRDKGAHNINLVTPTHFHSGIIKALRAVKPVLGIPVVYNTSGYERVETLRELEGLVDIYLPDIKYASEELAGRYSTAPDYPEVAFAALEEMYRQTGNVRMDAEGMMLSGVMVRHLVLPACRHDSMAVLRRIADTVPIDGILLSLMSQYTPEFARDSAYKALHRRLTRFEYDSVAALARSLGFDGYFQALSSATSEYTPDF